MDDVIIPWHSRQGNERGHNRNKNHEKTLQNPLDKRFQISYNLIARRLHFLFHVCEIFNALLLLSLCEAGFLYEDISRNNPANNAWRIQCARRYLLAYLFWFAWVAQKYRKGAPSATRGLKEPQAQPERFLAGDTGSKKISRRRHKFYRHRLQEPLPCSGVAAR